MNKNKNIEKLKRDIEKICLMNKSKNIEKLKSDIEKI